MRPETSRVSLFYSANLPVVLTPSVVLGAHIIAVEAPLSGDHGGRPCAARLVRYIRYCASLGPYLPTKASKRGRFSNRVHWRMTENVAKDMNRPYKGLTEVAPMHINGTSVTVTTALRLLVCAA